MFGWKSDDIHGPETFDRNAKRVQERFWPKMRRAAGKIPFAEDAVAAYFCALDSKTPFRVRATLMAALAYFVVPVDAVPDLLVGIGFADDATVLMTAISMLGAHLKPVHREAARRVLDSDISGKTA